MTNLDAIPFGKFCVTAADRAATAADRAATVRERTSFPSGPFPRRRLPVYPPGSCGLDRCHLKCRRGRRSLAENRTRREQGQAGAHVSRASLNLHTVHNDATCHFVTPGSKVERAMHLWRRHFPAAGAIVWERLTNLATYATVTNLSLRVPQIGQVSGGVPNSMLPQTGHR